VVPVKFVIKSVAVMVVVPAETRVARPFVPGKLLIAATPVSDEFQVTSVVRSSTVPGVNICVAVNCSSVVVLKEMTWSAGATSIDWKLLTVRFAFPERLFVRSVAVMTVDPAATDVTKPFEPVTLLTSAAAVFDEFHSTAEVQFNVVPSENVAVAVNGSIDPFAMLAVAGVTEID
jgi:hypothetical protein